ncbi:unnamed protein product [Rhodiola kirilowii]
MDFMKVFDQTVREIKREVNLKVLKVPEIEQKVLDATDNEPWGPHGSALAEIAQATKKFTECKMVMSVLWTRLGETGKDWRYVYKALTVIEYLVANGSEEAVDDIIEHTFRISSLSGFEYTEPNGKDMGINVRKKVENIVALLNNKDKIEEVRKKAATNRDKYVGVSSAGSTYKSGAAYGSSSYGTDYNGGRSSRREQDSFKENFKDDQFGEDRYVKSTSAKSRRGSTSEKHGDSLMNTQQKRSNDDLTSTKLPSNGNKSNKHDPASSKSSNVPSNYYDDEFDDFDPREMSTKSAATNSNQVDLFGESLFGDLMDAPTPIPTEDTTANSESADVDLFADATFVSAPSSKAPKSASPPQIQVDLFSSQPAVTSATAASFDFFGASGPIAQPEVENLKSEANTCTAVDPFASVPINDFNGSDPFSGFTSLSAPTSVRSSQNLTGSLDNLAGTSSRDSSTFQKKDAFQVNSGIWADSLSRGLIDLNISAPKQVNLADVGGLSYGRTTAEPLPEFYTAKPMSTASGYTSSHSKSMNGDDFFSSLNNGQQHQFNYLKK